MISIHAPRVGSDAGARSCDGSGANFNPRSPRGERRQSTARRARKSYFNPRSPRGERLRNSRDARDRHRFQSTLPAWGATSGALLRGAPRTISIHAPRVGSDLDHLVKRPCLCISIHAPRVGSDQSEQRTACRALANFNPRSPRGERPLSMRRVRTISQFQSTLPAWGATRQAYRDGKSHGHFNPRSPRGERRQMHLHPRQRRQHFNPRSPRGERRRASCRSQRGRQISIHAPRVGSDVFVILVGEKARISIHAPRVGSDAGRDSSTSDSLHFNPRSPRGERPAGAMSSTRIGAHFNPRSPRGERRACLTAERFEDDFNPRSPRGERLIAPMKRCGVHSISIHAPRVGSDVGA